MGVSTVGDKTVVELLELLLKSLSILENLLLVLDKLRGLSLLEGNSQSSDGVVVRTTLVTGEDGEVYGVLKVVENLSASLGVDGSDTSSEEDHGTTRTTERLVGGGGDNVGVLKGRGDDLSGNKTRNVGHVDDKVSTNLVSNLAHALIVNETAVGRGTGNKDLGSVEDGGLLEHVVVNDTSGEVDTVGHGLKVGGDSRNLSGVGLITVRKMATVGEVKTHETLVGSHDGLVDLEVGGRAREGLDIDTPLGRVNVEGLQSTLLAQSLNAVNVLVTTIVSGARVALRVLVAHGRSQGIKNGLGGEVLRGDENDTLLLALDFVVHDGGHIGVKGLQSVLEELGGVSDETGDGFEKNIQPCGIQKVRRKPLFAFGIVGELRVR